MIAMDTNLNVELLTPREVASLLRVDQRTLLRWEKAGKIRACRTLGGHRRYYAAEISSILNGKTRVA